MPSTVVWKRGYAVCSVLVSSKKHPGRWKYSVSEVPFLWWLYLCHQVPGQTACHALSGPSKEVRWRAGDFAICGTVRLWALRRRKRKCRHARDLVSESNSRNGLLLLKAVNVPQALNSPRSGLRENCWVQGLERKKDVIYFTYIF